MWFPQNPPLRRWDFPQEPTPSVAPHPHKYPPTPHHPSSSGSPRILPSGAGTSLRSPHPPLPPILTSAHHPRHTPPAVEPPEPFPQELGLPSEAHTLRSPQSSQIPRDPSSRLASSQPVSLSSSHPQEWIHPQEWCFPRGAPRARWRAGAAPARREKCFAARPPAFPPAAHALGGRRTPEDTVPIRIYADGHPILRSQGRAPTARGVRGRLCVGAETVSVADRATFAPRLYGRCRGRGTPSLTRVDLLRMLVHEGAPSLSERTPPPLPRLVHHCFLNFPQ